MDCPHCDAQFINKNSYATHKSRKHREFIRPNKIQQTLNAQTLEDSNKSIVINNITNKNTTNNNTTNNIDNSTNQAVNVSNVIINGNDDEKQSDPEQTLEKCHSIYVLITREYKKLKMPVYKVGVTGRSLDRRFWEYPLGSELLYTERCDINLEDKVLKNLSRHFELFDGREWFQGPINEILFVVRSTIALHSKKFNYDLS